MEDEHCKSKRSIGSVLSVWLASMSGIELGWSSELAYRSRTNRETNRRARLMTFTCRFHAFTLYVLASSIDRRTRRVSCRGNPRKPRRPHPWLPPLSSRVPDERALSTTLALCKWIFTMSSVPLHGPCAPNKRVARSCTFWQFNPSIMTDLWHTVWSKSHPAREYNRIIEWKVLIEKSTKRFTKSTSTISKSTSVEWNFVISRLSFEKSEIPSVNYHLCKFSFQCITGELQDTNFFVRPWGLGYLVACVGTSLSISLSQYIRFDCFHY